MEFTYIIPFKYSDDRLETLKKVLSNVRGFDCEIIVIEQGTESILPTKGVLNNEKYIFLNNPLPFNKAWSLNVAWKESKNDIIVFGDADNMISKENLFKSLEELNEYEFVSPHNKLIDLEPLENRLENEKIFEIKRHFRGEFDHQKMPLCGGTTIFKKESLEKIGGWPEEFFGWGAEDDAMSIKVRHFLKWKEMDFACYHLYHERVVPIRDFYYRNLQIYNNYLNAPKDKLEEYINNVKPSIGDKNKKLS
jgi:cellulose synthase/poly-beta-1,6-N-acetylglucosamine synthase-like glycosyltransferase